MEKKFGVIVGFGPLVSYEVVKRFIRENFEFLVIARSIDKISELANQLGQEVEPLQGDAQKIDELLPTIRKKVDEKGRLDLLHYNIGFGLGKLPLELDNEDLDDINQLATKTPLALIKEFSNDLEHTSGSFLVTGGGLAIHPLAKYSAYSIGNAAKRNLVFTLYQQLRHRVHVATVTIDMMVNNQGIAANIAEKFIQLYEEKKSHWRPEIVYSL